jgi:hypothetical protein
MTGGRETTPVHLFPVCEERGFATSQQSAKGKGFVGREKPQVCPAHSVPAAGKK